jgi:Peptidase family M50
MRFLRSLLASIFAISAVSSTVIVIASASGVFHPEHPASATKLILRFLGWMLFGAFAAIFAMGCWTHFTRKASERGWGIAAVLAMLTVILIPVVASLIFKQTHGSALSFSGAGIGLALLAGGVFAYGRRIEAPSAAAVEQEMKPMPGDGTFKVLNQLFGLVIAAMSYAAYCWWLKWTWDYYIPRPAGGIVGSTVWLIVLSLVITLVHELGHTGAGLALGMKLRVFYAGPFRWQNSGGRWEFKFAPKEILMAGGATGVVPAKPDFEAWRDVTMTVAGPMANLATAVAAFWMASLLSWDLHGAAAGLLFLFGAFSMATFAWNLIPVRLGHGFSDGARIYQVLSGGPWADFNRAQSLVISSLVTSVRPKDYEIETIERAAAKITRGPQALMLRFWACHHWLDRGQIENAVAALKDAERVYVESITNLPASLHTVFIIANALLLRDAEAVRQWGQRMEAKKPTNLNVDYWMAKSAVGWMAGNLAEAEDALAKSEAEAEKLPKAGAYEFDRFLCALLGEAISEAVVTV